MNKSIIKGTTSSLSFVDHNETYGRHIIRRICKIIKPNSCLDIGAGNGEDLKIIRESNENAKLWGVDYRPNNKNLFKLKANIITANLEFDELPIRDNSIDLIIANQTMEHVKEIYWINHQVFKKLTLNGHFLMGVPNLLALHNRFLPLFGYHPSCIKMISAHIRGYSIPDTNLFYKTIGGDFLDIVNVYGSQFYPFPKTASRIASKLLPGLATCIFFLIKKTGIYNNEFIEWTKNNMLETNYYIGH